MFWWRWGDFLRITEVPLLVLVSVVIPLHDLSAVLLFLACHVQNLSTESVNEVVSRILVFINSESLFWVIALCSQVQFSTFGIRFNSQEQVVLLALDQPVHAFLNQSETLVGTVISLPNDGSSLERSILGNIQDPTAVDGSEWVVSLGIFTVVIFLFFEQAENHVFERYGYIFMTFLIWLIAFISQIS